MSKAETIDARNLACPQPVILTRKALKENDQITVIVDNKTAQYNVTRMAQKAGYDVQAEQRDDGIYLHISGTGIAAAVNEKEASCALAQTCTGSISSVPCN